MRIWQVLFPDSRGCGDRAIRWQWRMSWPTKRVASDALRFAIKQLEQELPAEARQNTALLLLTRSIGSHEPKGIFESSESPLIEPGHSPVSSTRSRMLYEAKVSSSESLFFFQQRFLVAPCAWIGKADEVIPCAPLYSDTPMRLTNWPVRTGSSPLKKWRGYLRSAREGLLLCVEGLNPLLQNSVLGPLPGARRGHMAEPATLSGTVASGSQHRPATPPPSLDRMQCP